MFTGSQIFCWGGRDQTKEFADGAEYQPAFKKWTALPASPLAARSAHAGVWATTTRQFIIWGGQNTTVLGDGAAYDPTTGTWATLPAAPISARTPGAAVWTGTELLIWGGMDASGTRLNDGALYNPSTKAWRKIPNARLAALVAPAAGFAGGAFHYFGGIDTTTSSVIRWQGESLAPSTTSWSDITAPATGVLGPRVFPASWSVGGRWFLWSGYEDDGTGGVNFLTTGASYDPATKTWSAMSSTDVPLGRAFAIAHAMTNGAIVWSGYGKPGGGIMQAMRDGAIYVP